MNDIPIDLEDEEPVKLDLKIHKSIMIFGSLLFFGGFFAFFIFEILDILSLLDITSLPGILLLAILWLTFIGLGILGVTFMEIMKKEEFAKSKDEEIKKLNIGKSYLYMQVLHVFVIVGMLCFLFPPFWDIFSNLDIAFPIFILIWPFLLLLNIAMDTIKNPICTVPGRYRNKLKLLFVSWIVLYFVASAALVLNFIYVGKTGLLLTIFAVSLLISLLPYFYFLDNY